MLTLCSVGECFDLVLSSIFRRICFELLLTTLDVVHLINKLIQHGKQPES